MGKEEMGKRSSADNDGSQSGEGGPARGLPTGLVSPSTIALLVIIVVLVVVAAMKLGAVESALGMSDANIMVLRRSIQAYEQRFTALGSRLEAIEKDLAELEKMSGEAGKARQAGPEKGAEAFPATGADKGREAPDKGGPNTE